MSTLLIFIFVGMMVLWVLGYVGDQVSHRVMPSVPFLILAGFVGFVGVAAFNKLLS